MYCSLQFDLVNGLGNGCFINEFRIYNNLYSINTHNCTN